MKYREDIAFLSIFFITLISCNKNNSTIKTYNIALQENRSVSVDEFIKEIEIIPLETNNLSIIRDITKIESYRNIIYIFDLSQNNIFIFNNKGMYINKIDNKGMGPHEYLNISDFEIDKNTAHICVLDALKNNLLYYDLQGNFRYIENLPQLRESAYNNFQFVDGDHIMFWTSDENNRLKIYEKNKKITIMENLPKKGYPKLAYLFSDSLLLTEMSNLVFSYSKNEIDEYYKIEIENLKPNLRSHSFPKSYDSQAQLSFFEKLIKSESIDYLIKDIYSSSKYILLSFYRKSLYYTFIISKDTGLYFNFNSIDKEFIPFIKFVSLHDNFI